VFSPFSIFQCLTYCFLIVFFCHLLFQFVYVVFNSFSSGVFFFCWLFFACFLFSSYNGHSRSPLPYNRLHLVVQVCVSLVLTHDLFDSLLFRLEIPTFLYVCFSFVDVYSSLSCSPLQRNLSVSIHHYYTIHADFPYQQLTGRPLFFLF
jgi:hypothetical protein